MKITFKFHKIIWWQVALISAIIIGFVLLMGYCLQVADQAEYEASLMMAQDVARQIIMVM